MSIAGATAAHQRAPVNGLSWCPVIAVMRLSRMTTVAGARRCTTMCIRPVRPECANVESPITATTGDLGAAGERRAVSHADAGAHAHAAVHRRQRRQRGERVAADVARDHRLHLAQRVEHAAVRAARAQHRRTRRQIGARVARDRAHVDAERRADRDRG